MKMDISFSTLRDLSDLSYGKKLLGILESYGFIIDKLEEYEPIRGEFSPERFEEIWKGRKIGNSDVSSCQILFKGKQEIRFMCMVGWQSNIFPLYGAINLISLWLTVPKKYDLTKLINLADDIAEWSGAAYGYVSEHSRNISSRYIQMEGYSVSMGNIHKGIAGLRWVNYFGEPYLNSDGFHLPEDSVKIGSSARFIVTEKPDDMRLNDLDFLKTYISQIGKDWFLPFERVEGDKVFLTEEYSASIPSGLDGAHSIRAQRVPVFDDSEIADMNKKSKRNK